MTETLNHSYTIPHLLLNPKHLLLSYLLNLVPPHPRLGVATVAPALHDDRSLARRPYRTAAAEGKNVGCGGGILKVVGILVEERHQ